jgi:hypothetical protein
MICGMTMKRLKRQAESDTDSVKNYFGAISPELLRKIGTQLPVKMGTIFFRNPSVVGSNSVTQMEHKDHVRIVKRFTYGDSARWIAAGRIETIGFGGDPKKKAFPG